MGDGARPSWQQHVVRNESRGDVLCADHGRKGNGQAQQAGPRQKTSLPLFLAMPDFLSDSVSISARDLLRYRFVMMTTHRKGLCPARISRAMASPLTWAGRAIRQIGRAHV